MDYKSAVKKVVYTEKKSVPKGFIVLSKNKRTVKITKTKIIPDEKGIFYKHLGVKNLDNNFMAIITDGIIEKWWQNKKNSNIAETKPFNNQAIPENCIIYLSGTE